MNVVFRADASVQIGSGHVMRCLTLADELARRGHRCLFMCREHSGHLCALIAARGHTLISLPMPATKAPTAVTGDYADWLGVTWQEDASQTVRAMSSVPTDWLVVDHYALDARWERQLAGSAGAVMAIDDLANREHECALLLDQNLGRQAADYDGLVPDGCRRLIGPQFAPLRPEFASLRKDALERRNGRHANRILISLGGVDRTNVTGRILNALYDCNLPGSVELDVILGASAPHLEAVRKQIAESPYTATLNVDVRDMADRMCVADWCIGAAGGSAWERCCLGLPTMIVVLADNQIAGARALDAVGAGVVLPSPELIEQELPRILHRFTESDSLQAMNSAAAGVTDGQGTQRVADIMVAQAGRTECPTTL